ncbi:hypothetical protein CLOP_g7269 [Closterium sp. NIES-67]|nr:hypothetical protein CLOP_g7269 [Closterium sp. NIES-67]
MSFLSPLPWPLLTTLLACFPNFVRVTLACRPCPSCRLAHSPVWWFCRSAAEGATRGFGSNLSVLRPPDLRPEPPQSQQLPPWVVPQATEPSTLA